MHKEQEPQKWQAAAPHHHHHHHHQQQQHQQSPPPTQQPPPLQQGDKWLQPHIGIVAGACRNLCVFWRVLINQLIVLHSELITKKNYANRSRNEWDIHIGSFGIQSSMFIPPHSNVSVSFQGFKKMQKPQTFLFFCQRLEWYEVNFKVEILKIEI